MEDIEIVVTWPHKSGKKNICFMFSNWLWFSLIFCNGLYVHAN